MVTWWSISSPLALLSLSTVHHVTASFHYDAGDATGMLVVSLRRRHVHEHQTDQYFAQDYAQKLRFATNDSSHVTHR